MNEDHETRISNLLNSLVTRLEFEVNKQQPQQLPAITQSIVLLHAYRTGTLKMDEQHAWQEQLMRKITKEVDNFERGEEYGSDTTIQR